MGPEPNEILGKAPVRPRYITTCIAQTLADIKNACYAACMTSTHLPITKSIRISRQSLGDKIAMFAILTLCLVSAWGTYRQFALLVTLASMPIFVIAAIIPFGFSQQHTRLRSFDMILAPILLIVFSSNLWTLYPDAWMQQTFWYFMCTTAYLGIRLFSRTVQFNRLIAIASAVGGLIAVAMIRPGEQVDPFSLTVVRAAVQGHNPNFTAYCLAGVIFMLITFSEHLSRRGIEIWAALVVSAILFYGILVLDTRGAIVSVVLMALWTLAARFGAAKLAPAMTWTVLAGIFLFSFGALEWMGDALEAVLPSARQSGDLSGRITTWEFARLLISEHPWLGIGAGSFQFINPYEVGAHNLLLILTLDIGLVGMILFLLFFITGLWPGLRLNGSKSEKSLVGLFTCYFMPIAATGHFELSPFTWVVMAFTFSMLRDYVDYSASR